MTSESGLTRHGLKVPHLDRLVKRTTHDPAVTQRSQAMHAIFMAGEGALTPPRRHVPDLDRLVI